MTGLLARISLIDLSFLIISNLVLEFLIMLAKAFWKPKLAISESKRSIMDLRMGSLKSFIQSLIIQEKIRGGKRLGSYCSKLEIEFGLIYSILVLQIVSIIKYVKIISGIIKITKNISPKGIPRK